MGHEEFLAWEPNSHMAFRFNASSTSALAAFAEDYRIEPTAPGVPPYVGRGEPAGWPRAAVVAVDRSVDERGVSPFLANLRRYTDERFAATRHT